jgi:predicted nucleic acid-binding protein
MSKIFIDSNILASCLDQFDQEKRKKCRELIKTLTGDLRGVISTQVMQEFFVASTTKLGADVLTVKDILHSFERFETIIITPPNH